MTGKGSILVWKNGKSHKTIFHAPGCALIETSIINVRMKWPIYAALLHIFQGIGPNSRLPSIRYTTSEGGVDPSESP